MRHDPWVVWVADRWVQQGSARADQIQEDRRDGANHGSEITIRYNTQKGLDTFGDVGGCLIAWTLKRTFGWVIGVWAN